MGDVVIFGAGGLGRMVRDILRQGGRYRPVAFLDSNAAKHGAMVDDLLVAGGMTGFDELRKRGVAGAIVAIGNNEVRVELAEELERRGAELVSAIHPLASISPTARLERHLIIGPRVSICVHARVGAHTVLSSGAIIEHENVIGQGVFVHPAVRLAGTVSIEDGATLGIGACVIQGRRIGRGAHVEPGAVVIRDVPAGGRVGGVPATMERRTASRFVPQPLPMVEELPV